MSNYLFGLRAAATLYVSLLLCPAALAQLGGPSTGIYPENGMYWNTDRAGEGMFVEVQGTSVGFGIFTYRENGSPVFYTGGGEIQSLPQEEQRQEGYYPAHVVFSDIFEYRNGPIFAIDGGASARETEAVSAGSVRLEFGEENIIILYVTLTGEVAEGQPRSSRRSVSQLAFGINTFGVNTLTALHCRTDLRGEWVFVDLSTPSRTPWRFNFTELEVSPSESAITCPSLNPEGLLILSYRDPVRGAELRCVTTRSSPPVPDPLDGRMKKGCELRLQGSDEVVFWASPSDIGLKEITATLGAYPGTGHVRGTARVNGIRIR